MNLKNSFYDITRLMLYNNTNLHMNT